VSSLVITCRLLQAALCRSAVPQASDLIARMAANCPSATLMLLRGVLETYRRALKESHSGIVAACKSSVVALAVLSVRETKRVVAVLKREEVMVDICLDLCLQSDRLSAATLVIESLSRSATVMPVKPIIDVDDELEDKEVPIIPPSFILASLLENNPELLGRTVDGLTKGITESSSSSSPSVIWGRVNVMLSAYIWIICKVKFDRLHKKKCVGNMLMSMTNGCQELSRVLLALNAGSGKALDVHFMDRPFRLIVCATVCTLSQSFAVPMAEDVARELRDASWSTVEVLLTCEALSAESQSFCQQVQLFLQHQDALCIQQLIFEVLLDHQSVAVTDERQQVHEDGLTTIINGMCSWVHAKNLLPAADLGDTTHSPCYEDLESIAVVFDSATIPDDVRAREAKKMLQYIVLDESKVHSRVANPMLSRVIELATTVLSTSKGYECPLVLPLELEKLCISLADTFEMSQASSIVLMVKIMYCLYFCKLCPKSPFAVDSRCLPMRKLVDVMDNDSISCFSRPFRDAFRELCLHAMPEVAKQSASWRLFQQEKCAFRQTKTTKADLRDALRRMVKDSSWDPDGVICEWLFVSARVSLSEGELISTVASALWSDVHSPPMPFSYVQLCKDPLAIMRCPLQLWSCAGIRRVVLCCLSSLLDSNDSLVSSLAPSTEVEREILASRDVIIARSLISTLTSTHESVPYSMRHCPATSLVVRRLISQSYGVVAALVKMSMDNHIVDWMLEMVPEAMDHISALKFLLYDDETLTNTEKLLVSDKILRIVLVHGHRSIEAPELIVSTLNQLLASFYLIIGPVGIAVNTLLVAENAGLDATQLTRQAAFRMLKAIPLAKGYSLQVRSDCVALLQRLVDMCRGDSTLGLPVNMTTRQKKLVKDLTEAAGKSANALGVTVQT
jgi:hypothetical protein